MDDYDFAHEMTDEQIKLAKAAGRLARKQASGSTLYDALKVGEALLIGRAAAMKAARSQPSQRQTIRPSLRGLEKSIRLHRPQRLAAAAAVFRQLHPRCSPSRRRRKDHRRAVPVSARWDGNIRPCRPSAVESRRSLGRGAPAPHDARPSGDGPDPRTKRATRAQSIRQQGAASLWPRHRRGRRPSGDRRGEVRSVARHPQAPKADD